MSSTDASAPCWANAVLAAAVLLLALFLSIELRSRQPITPLHLFTNRNRSSAHAIRLLLVAGMFGTASRNAASQSVAGASTTTKVRDVLTTGISSAFTASTILIACSLLLAAVAITSRASQPGRLPAGRG